MENNTTVIACNAFHDALDYLDIAARFPGIRFLYLPASLHLKPLELKKRILSEIQSLPVEPSGVCCLYGHCFPDIDVVLENENVRRLPCSHCYEKLLGQKQFDAIIKKEPGTFFVEKELLLNFDAYCWTPLEFDDPKLREWYFKHYRQLLYIRQPGDPDLGRQAQNIADRLQLALKVVDADYEELNTCITQIVSELVGR